MKGAGYLSLGVGREEIDRLGLHLKYFDFDFYRFLVEAVQFLEQHTTMHGLFRKAGSVARQKMLKVSGVCVCTMDGTLELDIHNLRDRLTG